MVGCERSDKCSIFSERMGKMPTIAELFRKRLCFGNKNDCARYRVYRFLDERNYDVDVNTMTKIEQIMPGLYPNELERVRGIISN